MIGVIIFSLLSGIGFSLVFVSMVSIKRVMLKHPGDAGVLLKPMLKLALLAAFTLQGIAYTFAYASGY